MITDYKQAIQIVRDRYQAAHGAKLVLLRRKMTTWLKSNNNLQLQKTLPRQQKPLTLLINTLLQLYRRF